MGKLSCPSKRKKKIEVNLSNFIWALYNSLKMCTEFTQWLKSQ